MDFLLQLWGGSFSLLSKICLSQSSTRLRRLGWWLNITCQPPWIIILIQQHNWMAGAVEAGGIPAMVLGLIKSREPARPIPASVERGVAIFSYGLAAAGVSYSLYDFHGLTSFTQVLELFSMTGYLLGNYWLAKGQARGWLGQGLNNVSVGVLMAVEGKPWLALQQAIALIFVVRGYLRSKQHGG